MTDRIRDARASDRAAIEAVTLSAYEQYRRGDAARPLGPLPREHRDHPRRGAPDTQIVAEEDGRIVGAVLLYPAGARLDSPGGASMTLTFPEVRLLAVAPSARGQGIGALLMDECVRRARESGAEALTLHTTEMMASGHAALRAPRVSRMPELDFEPAPGVTVKGFRLDLSPGIAS
jgi:predicted N-acetyltransferase YhbS